MEHLDRKDDVCQTALDDRSVSNSERITLLSRSKRLDPDVTEDNAECDILFEETHIRGRPMNRTVGEKSRFIGYDDENCTVEELVNQHNVINGGWYGIHCEGSVIQTLYGLFMWNIIFANVPDVFQTPYQSAPLDISYPSLFYQSRKIAIENRLAQITSWNRRDVVTELDRIWKTHYVRRST